MIRTADERGIPVADLLTNAGLSREFFEDPDARIPGPVVLAIWNGVRERSGDPALQLSAPASLPFGAYRAIDYLVAASSTVGEGLTRFVRFFRLIADAVSLTIDHENGERVLSLSMASGAPVPPVYVDYIFAALVTRIRMRIQPSLRVARLELRQPEPVAAARYRETFGAPVQFGAAADRLYISDEEWSAPTATADAPLAEIMEDHARVLEQRLSKLESRAGSGVVSDVQRQIIAAPSESGSAVSVARALNMSVRTLQRKLVEAGTTFAEVSNTIRGELAEQYLADPKVSIAEVAFLLGFSEQSSFNRAFHRWTGEPPGRWRRQRAKRA